MIYWTTEVFWWVDQYVFILSHRNFYWANQYVEAKEYWIMNNSDELINIARTQKILSH
jgi:hypothetical protein